jgi:hypothetical protein
VPPAGCPLPTLKDTLDVLCGLISALHAVCIAVGAYAALPPRPPSPPACAYPTMRHPRHQCRHALLYIGMESLATAVASCQGLTHPPCMCASHASPARVPHTSPCTCAMVSFHASSPPCLHARSHASSGHGIGGPCEHTALAFYSICTAQSEFFMVIAA